MKENTNIEKTGTDKQSDETPDTLYTHEVRKKFFQFWKNKEKEIKY